MSFLTPLFLLGALAIGVPVVFHLIRRTTRQRISFSSLMFLQSSPPRLTHRSRLEHILLLLLRCAVICLLALGFARPFIKKTIIPPSLNTPSRQLVVLVDTSASMRRANLWEDARSRVSAILTRTSPADQVAIFSFDKHVYPLVTFEQWNAMAAGERVEAASKKLAETTPGWLATDLGSALVSAAETLADTTGKPTAQTVRQVVVVSDLQEGSRLEPLQNYEWPKEIHLVVEALRVSHPDNAGLHLITGSDEDNTGNTSTVRVRVSNEPTSKKEQFKIGWVQPDGRTFIEKPIELYVPAGQSRTAILPTQHGGTLLERILLQGDDNDFDNTVFVVPPEQARLSVFYSGTDSETNSRAPLYFLRRAFQETQRQAVKLTVHLSNQPLLPEEAKAAALFVVNGALPDDRTQLFREQVASGKTLLFSLANPSFASILARLLDVNHLEVESANPSRYAMLSEIDFTHPLFAPFADPRFSDFTKIHFWKYNRIDAGAISGAHVLAKFDNGDPAVIEVPLGKGRVIILAFGWGADDSQFALSTKFVPFLYSMLEQSSGMHQLPNQYFVGDALPLPSLPGLDQVTIKTPDGKDLKLAPAETNFSHTFSPGIYRIDTPRSYRFAVNLDAAESRTAALSPDELERHGLAISSPASNVSGQAPHPARLQNAELENRQKIWRDVLIAAIGILLIESWLAGRAARRVTVSVT
jgi:hypothetical protein